MVEKKRHQKVPGTAIICREPSKAHSARVTAQSESQPCVDERIVLMTFRTQDVPPYVDPDQHIEIKSVTGTSSAHLATLRFLPKPRCV